MQKDDEFNVTTKPKRAKIGKAHRSFVSLVMAELNKSGPPRPGFRKGTGGVKRGRGQVAAKLAGQALNRKSRRAVIKTRIVQLAKASPKSVATHLRYIERDGVSRSGEPGQAYGPTNDTMDLKAFEEKGRGDRHQFRMIVSPEDANDLGDLRMYTRHLMSRIGRDLGTELDWVAVDHWDTGSPHTHIVLRGRVGKGRNAEDLVINQEYLVDGMRKRACELSTSWLGPRTEREIQLSQLREVEQQHFTGLDRVLQRAMIDDEVHIDTLNQPAFAAERSALIGRLQKLEAMSLARKIERGVWRFDPDWEDTLRRMGERIDIVRTMQRAMGQQQRELAVFDSQRQRGAIVGRVAGKGLTDELTDRGYLVVDGIDGRAHYVVLPNRQALDEFPVGSIVEVKGAPTRQADQTIAELARDGIYRVDYHRTFARADRAHKDPDGFVDAHVRRLEALRRASIVERLNDSAWRIPQDLPELGRAFDAKRLTEAAVELRSQLPIQQQQRTLGATWLDQQLIDGGKNIARGGFGGEVWDALKERAEYLIEQGLAQRNGERVKLSPNLLSTLRQRNVDRAGATIEKETGHVYRRTVDGQRISGTYRQSIQLASGRFAMLDDGIGFSLVPWRPVIEKDLGRNIGGIVRGNDISWQLGRDRGLSR